LLKEESTDDYCIKIHFVNDKRLHEMSFIQAFA